MANSPIGAIGTEITGSSQTLAYFSNPLEGKKTKEQQASAFTASIFGTGFTNTDNTQIA